MILGSNDTVNSVETIIAEAADHLEGKLCSLLRASMWVDGAHAKRAIKWTFLQIFWLLYAIAILNNDSFHTGQLTFARLANSLQLNCIFGGFLSPHTNETTTRRTFAEHLL